MKAAKANQYIMILPLCGILSVFNTMAAGEQLMTHKTIPTDFIEFIIIFL